MSLKKSKVSTEMIATFINRGGEIKYCNPKNKPKHRTSKRTVFTRDQLKSIVGQKSYSNLSSGEAI